VVTGGPYANEDFNRNLILDAGEDVGLDPCHGDGELTPPSSAAGTLPSTVTTDENGLANFDLVYLKSSGWWIQVEVTASTLVLGTETTSSLGMRLPIIESEKGEHPHSPYGAGTLPILVSSTGPGSISPAGPVVLVTPTFDVTFFIAPNLGCFITDVMVDGVSEFGVPLLPDVPYVYTFEEVTDTHTIHATFGP